MIHSGYLYENRNNKTDLEDRLEILKGEIESQISRIESETNTELLEIVKLFDRRLLKMIFYLKKVVDLIKMSNDCTVDLIRCKKPGCFNKMDANNLVGKEICIIGHGRNHRKLSLVNYDQSGETPDNVLFVDIDKNVAPDIVMDITKLTDSPTEQFKIILFINSERMIVGPNNLIYEHVIDNLHNMLCPGGYLVMTHPYSDWVKNPDKVFIKYMRSKKFVIESTKRFRARFEGDDKSSMILMKFQKCWS